MEAGGAHPGGDGAQDRVASAARSTLFLTPVVAVVGLVGSIVVVRILEPEDYALFALAIAIRGTLQFIADLGTGVAGARAFAELHRIGARAQAREAYRKLFALRVAAVALLAAVVLGLPGPTAELLGLRDDERWFLTFIVLIGAAEMTWSLAGATLNGLFAQALVWRVNLVQAFMQPVLVIAAAVAGLGLQGIVGAVLAASVLRVALINVYAWRTIAAIPDRGARLQDLRRMYGRVAGSSVLGKLASFAHSRSVVTIIAIGALPRAEVATFALAYDITHQVLTMIASPLVALLLPAMAGRDPAEVQALLRRSTRALALAVLPAAAVLLAAWPALVHVLFGAEYDGTIAYAAIILPLLALETMLGAPATAVMLAQERFVAIYGRLKAVMLVSALVYLVVAQVDLLTAAAVMMGVRSLSAISLHVVLRSRGLAVPARWLVRLALAVTAAGAAGWLAGQAAPGRAADIVLIPLVAAAAALALIRAARLFDAGDADIAARVLPFGRRWFVRLAS